MKKKVDAHPTRYIKKTIDALSQTGLLLVSGNSNKTNVMTIGWGLMGTLWGRPFFIVAVRPTRYTYQLIEETGEFTINVPTKNMKAIVSYCGMVSGRDHDKFIEKQLTLLPGKNVKSPVIAECIIHYECKVAFKTQFASPPLSNEEKTRLYPTGDYHKLYYGEIVASYANK
jgi:flavin reductase (DIM6/NTAB) family NADH-FMN oxidoreductase RutF